GSSLHSFTTRRSSDLWIDNVIEGSTLEDELQSAQFDIRHDLHAGHLRALTFGARTADREKEVIWSDFVMNRSVDNGEVVAFPQEDRKSTRLNSSHVKI